MDVAQVELEFAPCVDPMAEVNLWSFTEPDYVGISMASRTTQKFSGLCTRGVLSCLYCGYEDEAE